MKQGILIYKEHKLPCYIALSHEDQERGLMGVKPPVPNMVFLYSSPMMPSFWMKNTPAPLDIVFCNDDVVVDIKQGEPFSTKLINASSLSNMIIEFNSGTCNSLGIKIGDKINLKF